MKNQERTEDFALCQNCTLFQEFCIAKACVAAEFVLFCAEFCTTELVAIIIVAFSWF